MITIIPVEGINDILAIIQGTIGDAMPFAMVIMGIIIALYIIGGLFPVENKK